MRELYRNMFLVNKSPLHMLLQNLIQNYIKSWESHNLEMKQSVF